MAVLLARAAATRYASRTLAGAAVITRAWSEVMCRLATDRREQWETWHAGIAALTRLTSDRPKWRVLRTCMVCDAVCFTPSDSTLNERWDDPPEWIRGRLRGRWDSAMLSHGLCPVCLPTLYPELVTDSRDVPASEMVASLVP